MPQISARPAKAIIVSSTRFAGVSDQPDSMRAAANTVCAGEGNPRTG